MIRQPRGPVTASRGRKSEQRGFSVNAHSLGSGLRGTADPAGRTGRLSRTWGWMCRACEKRETDRGALRRRLGIWAEATSRSEALDDSWLIGERLTGNRRDSPSRASNGGDVLAGMASYLTPDSIVAARRGVSRVGGYLGMSQHHRGTALAH